MNIDEMPAGRELDELIAKKIFGLELCKCDKYLARTEMGGLALKCLTCGLDFALSYSTDIAAAWQVVEKCGLLDLWRGLYRDADRDEWFVVDEPELGIENMVGRGNTAPLAICRAALKVVIGER